MKMRAITSAFLLLAAYPALARSVPEPTDLAAAAESLRDSPEETRAAAAKAAFDKSFELDNAGDSATGEPDFHSIFRKGILEKIGKKRVTVIPNVEYGVLFTGPSNYHEGERTRIPPASTNKIFTTALVLKELGGDYTFDTRLTWVESPTSSAEAGYLTFVASGDPSLATSDLPKLTADYANALAAAGVKKVYGGLKFSATDDRWNVRAVPDGWEPGDLRTATGFIPNALGTLTEARVKTAFVAALLKKGIKTISTTAPFAMSEGSVGFSSHFSAPLRELIKPFVLHSINYKGEAFLRKIGELRGSSSAENLNDAALPVLKDFVASMVGPDGGFENVVLNDGSGLSRKSRVTAEVMVNFLNAVKLEPYFKDFLAALPTAGRTGTLDRRMSRTSAAGRVHAKTGTLEGNYQLVGYLAEETQSGVEYHSFAILTQTTAASGAYCHGVEDSAISSLAGWMLKK
jgi:D-alanyl-D-alanine carboxypeptidase